MWYSFLSNWTKLSPNIYFSFCCSGISMETDGFFPRLRVLLFSWSAYSILIGINNLWNIFYWYLGWFISKAVDVHTHTLWTEHCPRRSIVRWSNWRRRNSIYLCKACIYYRLCDIFAFYLRSQISSSFLSRTKATEPMNGGGICSGPVMLLLFQ